MVLDSERSLDYRKPRPRVTYCGIPPYLEIPGDDKVVDVEIANPVRTEYTHWEWLYRMQILFIIIFIFVCVARVISRVNGV